MPTMLVMLMIRPLRRFIMPLVHRPHGVERALEVGVQHRVPVGLAQAEQDVVPGEAGVVDQDVDRAEGLLRRGDGRVDLGGLGDVAGDADGAVAELAATSCAFAASRPTIATLAPAACSACAMARPMPRVLPVTNATLPGRDRSSAHAPRNFSTSSAVPSVDAGGAGHDPLEQTDSTCPGPISTKRASGTSSAARSACTRPSAPAR